MITQLDVKKKKKHFKKIYMLNNTTDNKLLLSEEQKVGKMFQSRGNARLQKGRQVVQECVPASWSARGGSKGWWW